MSRALGVDVGGTRTKWVALADGEVIDGGVEETPAGGPEALAARIGELRDRVGGVDRVGIAMPAVIDFAANRATIVPNLPAAWTEEPLADLVEAAVGRPAALCNDARAFALAEATRGAGRGHATVACVTLGTGVGGGVVLDGRPHGGRAGRAGEFGHLIVEPDGLPCACGGRGCLESYAGGRSIVQAAVDAGLSSAAPRSPLAVVEAARAGDAIAVAVLDRAARAIGLALANVSTLFSPDVVVIGGGVSGALDLLQPGIERTVAAQSPAVPPVHIRPAQLGEHAGAIGAALWKDHA